MISHRFVPTLRKRVVCYDTFPTLLEERTSEDQRRFHTPYSDLNTWFFLLTYKVQTVLEYLGRRKQRVGSLNGYRTLFVRVLSPSFDYSLQLEIRHIRHRNRSKEPERGRGVLRGPFPE